MEYKPKPMEEQRTFPNYKTIASVALVFIATTLVIIKGLHQPQADPPTGSQTGPTEFQHASKEIISSLDMILSLGNVSFYLPRGSTNLSGYLSMIPREPNLYPLAGESWWSRPFVINIVYLNYQGTPAPSIDFMQPVQLCFQISEEQWQDFTQRQDAYQVEYYADGSGVPRWVPLHRSANPQNRQVCGATDHLSLFALAIKAEEPTQTPTIAVATATSTPTNTPVLLIPTPTRKHEKDISPNQPPPPPPPPIP
jgi:hypothetical protein